MTPPSRSRCRCTTPSPQRSTRRDRRSWSRLWGSRLAAGAALGGFSLTEPHAGSDAAAITTRAVADGDGWRLHGRKAWVSLAGVADLFLVVCRTGEGGGHGDVAIAAVAREQAGVSFPIIYEKAASSFLPIGEMLLEGAAATMLAPPGSGMRAALAAIDVARCDIAAIACGLHAEALDVALAYARDRQAFGSRVLDFQGIRWQLADVATELEASRLLVRQAAERLGTAEGAGRRRPCQAFRAGRGACGRRSRAARCWAPTAGCTTTRWRASSRWRRCCRWSTARPRSSGW